MFSRRSSRPPRQVAQAGDPAGPLISHTQKHYCSHGLVPCPLRELEVLLVVRLRSSSYSTTHLQPLSRVHRVRSSFFSSLKRGSDLCRCKTSTCSLDGIFNFPSEVNKFFRSLSRCSSFFVEPAGACAGAEGAGALAAVGVCLGGILSKDADMYT